MSHIPVPDGVLRYYISVLILITLSLAWKGQRSSRLLHRIPRYESGEFDLSIKINREGGAFVCGESTALMASLEGKVCSYC